MKLFGWLAGGTVPSEVEPPIVPAECGRVRGVLVRHVDPALMLERSIRVGDVSLRMLGDQ